MWQGRFKDEPAELARQYSQSVSFDWRLYRHDIEGSIAHAAALADAGILTASEFSQIEKALREIEAEIDAGKFAWDEKLEDVHMNIEAALTKRIGATGAKLHTARSRNDQVALDLRLYARAETAEVQKRVRELQRSLVDLASRHQDAIMPGYTHLQRAQPIFFAHHLLAYVEMLERDHARLCDSLGRTNTMPLGSGALAGSTIVLDRELIAKKLGFGAITQNSLDAVSDRDFVCELLFCLALIGTHLSRLSEDLILWTTSEFGFATFSDAFSTGSSLMPQKKNPDMAELTRGKTGRLYGNLVSVLTTLKGLPMSYNRDLQEDKHALFDSIDTAKMALEVCAAMLPGLTIHESRMEEAASDPNLLATDLADYLVKKNLPFREAHEAVGKLVAKAAERKVPLDRLPLAEMRAISALFESDAGGIFNVRAALEKRGSIGAPSSANVRAQLERWRKIL
jgi:argininosuccinate lyase